MVCVSTLQRCRKIRVYLDAENCKKAKRFFGLSRYWFNQAIEHLRQEGTTAKLSEVRAIQKREHPTWAFDCPQRVREHAMADAVHAVKVAKRKYLRSGQLGFVSFRSRKDLRQRFGFDAKSLSGAGVFRGEHRIVFRCEEELPEVKQEGTRLVRESGRWFLVVPTTVTVSVPENQRCGTVAVDPGVRCFATVYSEVGVAQFGKNDFGRIHRLCSHLDSLYSRMTQANARRRRRMRMAAARIRWRIRDLVSELHRQVANYLVSMFDRVLIPTFETSQMVTKLRSKTARAMLTWAHFRFRQVLQSTAERRGCQVQIVDEAYTSRTCSYCGRMFPKNSRPTISCCVPGLDRDINGARGIFLRALAASPSVVA